MRSVGRSIMGRFLAIALVVAVCNRDAAAEPQHRGIWMHASYIKTPAQADRCVELIDRAHLNAVYLLVWYWGGQAAFQSQFCPMLDGVQAGYDPMAGYAIWERLATEVPRSMSEPLFTTHPVTMDRLIRMRSAAEALVAGGGS